MRTILLALSLAACSPAPSRNVAEDTVLYVEPKAKCERVVTSDAYDATRCEMPGGGKVYCIANDKGFTCQALTTTQAPKKE